MPETEAKQPKDGNKLTVVVANIPNDEGQIRIQIRNPEDEVVEQARVPARPGEVEHIFEDMPAGRYALRVHHDADGDDEMDTNFVGVPTEGYAFSNNARSRFGPPALEKQLFRVNGPTRQRLKLIN
jgi:uncharacterized protein (DUF2141 family)